MAVQRSVKSLWANLVMLSSQFVATTSALLGVPDVVLETVVLYVRVGCYSVLVALFSV